MIISLQEPRLAFTNLLQAYIHPAKILKGHRYISHRVHAMTLQLRYPVFSRSFDNFQQNLQEVLSKIQFTMSSGDKLCQGPFGIHGIKIEN